MSKRLIVAILLLVLVVAAVAVAGCGGGLPSDAVAKVGNTPILKSDFDKRVTEFAAQYQVASKEDDPEGWAQFQGEVLEYLVTYQLAAQKAPSLGVTVSDAEVQTEIDSIVSQYYGDDQQKFQDDLTKNNLTLDSLKNNYRETMLMQKVYDKVTASITTVPDTDIQAYYDAHKSDYFQDETRTARHILIAPGTSATNPTTTTTAASDSSTATTGDTTTTTEESTTTTSELTQSDWDAALATAQEVRAKLVAGGDWKTLAAEYSDDPSTKDSGGDLGEISKGQMVQEFEDAVFSQKLNEISQPVKTTYGYHIIEVTAINAAKQSSLDEVKSDIQSTLLNQKKTDAWQKWVEDTKKEIGVTYAKGMEPTTTTTAASTTTTAAVGGTTPPSATSGSDTTAATAASATTTAGETIGASDTTTTAKP